MLVIRVLERGKARKNGEKIIFRKDDQTFYKFDEIYKFTDSSWSVNTNKVKLHIKIRLRSQESK